MSHLPILRVYAMDTTLPHGLASADMLAGKMTILFDDYPNTQSSHRQTNQQYREHNNHFIVQS